MPFSEAVTVGLLYNVDFGFVDRTTCKIGLGLGIGIKVRILSASTSVF